MQVKSRVLILPEEVTDVKNFGISEVEDNS